MWYTFTAWNQETRYGWTRDESVALAALEWLNRGREINVYSMVVLGDTVSRPDLSGRNDHLFTDDTRADEFEE